MKKYRGVDVSEAQLEDLLRQAPELLEEGMRFVDHQRKTVSGRLDVLLVDSGRALVVAELKVVEDDGMLMQAVDYYDHVAANLEAFARVYRDCSIDPQQTPRLLLIAPSFSVSLLNRLKWIDIPIISLFTYRCIELEDSPGHPVPVYSEIKGPAAPEPLKVTTLDQHFTYITNDSVRSKAQEIVTALRALGPTISAEPVKSGISVKRNGRVFAYIWPHRKYFGVGCYGLDGQWTSFVVDADTNLDETKQVLNAAFARPAA